ncbi:MAG: rRNA maturation RNase YbeY [Lachnospiraceae bacterium]|nr:rRNA maturation RNase YbeY [Lachnospiraceae bacterium]
MKFEIEWEVETFSEPPLLPLLEQVGAAFAVVCSVPENFEVNVLMTDHDRMQAINLETRGIDRSTDVLSFPMLDILPGTELGEVFRENAYMADPESGCLVLGDMVLNVERVREQAEEYGHSLRRELAFLTCHSLLHLIGYDHMEEDEKAEMEEQQRRIMVTAGISRED